MFEIEFVSYSECEELEFVWSVNYRIIGNNRPATRNEPPEYADLEIESKDLKEVNVFITIDGKQFKSTLTDVYLLKLKELALTTIDKDKLETACWEDAEKEVKRRQEDMYFYGH